MQATGGRYLVVGLSRPRGSSRRAQETFGEEIVLRLDARQDEEISAAHWLDVLLELFAVEARLHGEKACGEVRLKADEQEPHVELAGGCDAARIIVAPTQNAVGLRVGSARIGEADVGGEGHPCALRIGRIVGR